MQQNKDIVRKAEAWGFDQDKQNLFPVPTPTENMEESAEGVYDLMPKPTIREHSYGNMPLMIRPDYSGDFLQKLVEKFKNKCAADADSLTDFSCPEEMLKHQEEPQVRDVQDEFYENNRPGEGAGYDILKDYYNRGWDPTDSPEMSEDKILRMDKAPDRVVKPVKLVFRSAEQRVIDGFLNSNSQNDLSDTAKVVVARYLMATCPLELDEQEYAGEGITGSRVAKLLKDFENTQIYTKSKGWRKPDHLGVSVRLFRAEPRAGRWTFRTSSGNDTYMTVFQFIPEGRIVEANKLNVRVSCTCPSFLFWGAQFNAVMGDYFYGKIRPKFTPPKHRDPLGKFLVCKHVLACMPIVGNYRLQPISEQLKKKIRQAPKIELNKKVPKEEIHIPDDLLYIADKPEIKDIVNKWEHLSRGQKRSFIMNRTDPEEVAFMAHQFPDTATVFVVEKLKDIAAKSKKAEDRMEARDLLQEII